MRRSGINAKRYSKLNRVSEVLNWIAGILMMLNSAKCQ
jgi:hypothetical protein